MALTTASTASSVSSDPAWQSRGAGNRSDDDDDDAAYTSVFAIGDVQAESSSVSDFRVVLATFHNEPIPEPVLAPSFSSLSMASGTSDTETLSRSVTQTALPDADEPAVEKLSRAFNDLHFWRGGYGSTEDLSDVDDQEEDEYYQQVAARVQARKEQEAVEAKKQAELQALHKASAAATAAATAAGDHDNDGAPPPPPLDKRQLAAANGEQQQQQEEEENEDEEEWHAENGRQKQLHSGTEEADGAEDPEDAILNALLAEELVSSSEAAARARKRRTEKRKRMGTLEEAPEESEEHSGHDDEDGGDGHHDGGHDEEEEEEEEEDGGQDESDAAIAAAAAAAAAASSSELTKYCADCGYSFEYEPRATYCSECGATRGTKAAKPQPNYALTAIEQLLAESDVNLEALLMEEDLIRECKYNMNSQLIDFLSRPKTVRQLIKHVISLGGDKNKNKEANGTGAEEKEDSDSDADSTPGDSEGVYAHVAAEIFSCELVPVLETLFSDPSLPPLLFSILNSAPPLDPYLVLRFRKVMLVVLKFRFEQLVQFFRSQPVFLDRLVEHIGTYSMMELLRIVGWDNRFQQHVPAGDVEWVLKRNIITKLVGKLNPKFADQSEVHENTSVTLVELIRTAAPHTVPLLSELHSPAVLTDLLDHLFSGNPSSLKYCMLVLTELIKFHSNKEREAAELAKQGKAQNNADEDKSVTAGSNVTNKGTPAKKADTSANDDNRPFRAEATQLKQHIKSRLDLFHGLLTTPPKCSIKTQYGELRPPVGESRMKAVELFKCLIMTEWKDIHQDIVRLRVLKIMLDLFFEYEWNNILHVHVSQSIAAVLSGTSLILRHSLFADGKLVPRLVEAHKSCRVGPNGSSRRHRPGHMGHVIGICNRLAYGHMHDEILKNYLQNNPEWNSFVASTLTDDNKRQDVFLGGDDNPRKISAGLGAADMALENLESQLNQQELNDLLQTMDTFQDGLDQFLHLVTEDLE